MPPRDPEPPMRNNNSPSCYYQQALPNVLVRMPQNPTDQSSICRGRLLNHDYIPSKSLEFGRSRSVSAMAWQLAQLADSLALHTSGQCVESGSAMTMHSTTHPVVTNQLWASKYCGSTYLAHLDGGAGPTMARLQTRCTTDYLVVLLPPNASHHQVRASPASSYLVELSSYEQLVAVINDPLMRILWPSKTVTDGDADKL